MHGAGAMLPPGSLPSGWSNEEYLYRQQQLAQQQQQQRQQQLRQQQQQLQLKRIAEIAVATGHVMPDFNNFQIIPVGLNSNCVPMSSSSSSSSSDSQSTQQRLDAECRRHLSRSESVKTSCSSSSSSSSSSGNKAAASSSKVERYKTEMCRPFEDYGSCKYGDKCQFAHGAQELRGLARHPKYKTDKCRTFYTTGLCPYGQRCHFIHTAPSSPQDDLLPPPSPLVVDISAQVPLSGAGVGMYRVPYPPVSEPQVLVANQAHLDPCRATRRGVGSGDLVGLELSGNAELRHQQLLAAVAASKDNNQLTSATDRSNGRVSADCYSRQLAANRDNNQLLNDVYSSLAARRMQYNIQQGMMNCHQNPAPMSSQPGRTGSSFFEVDRLRVALNSLLLENVTRVQQSPPITPPLSGLLQGGVRPCPRSSGSLQSTAASSPTKSTFTSCSSDPSSPSTTSPTVDMFDSGSAAVGHPIGGDNHVIVSTDCNWFGTSSVWSPPSHLGRQLSLLSL